MSMQSINLPMSHSLRKEYPDAGYHIMNKGGRIEENNREELFGGLTRYEPIGAGERLALLLLFHLY